jgi:hypothetical protein
MMFLWLVGCGLGLVPSMDVDAIDDLVDGTSADGDGAPGSGGGAGNGSGDDTDDDGGDDPVDMDCPEDVEVFATHVWEPVLSNQCVLCHIEGGIAGETRMVLDPEDMLTSLRAAARVADSLLEKPTGTHADGHVGGTLIDADSSEAKALEFWVEWTQGTCEEPEVQTCTDAPSQRRLWRLTHSEYDNTIADLLGIATAMGDTFAADTEIDGFHNDAAALTVGNLLADQYRSAAEDLSATVDMDDILPCDPDEVGATTCAVLFIDDFGLRAFRRPLNSDEIERYGLFWAEISESDGFEEGVRWVVAAMLQSPHFLYRSELGILDEDALWRLTDWEVATELSYLLWATMPDETLLSAAAAGELSTPAQIQAQVERMADDPRLLSTASHFVATWLELDRLRTVSREGLTDELRSSMRDETDALVQEMASVDGTLEDLMLSRITHVDDNLAEHYGTETTGWVSLDGTTRGGLLTQGSVLTTHALSNGSSPIHRGVLVRERLLCEELPPPPPMLDTSPPEVDPTLTTRERYAQHSNDPACASCHDKIDPIGFGFENFDGLGRFRDEESGQLVDATGAVDAAEFDGVFDLAETLMDDARFRSCFVKTWRRWATGDNACADDPGAVGLTEPLLGITQRARFTHRTSEAEGDEADTLAQGDRLDTAELDDIALALGEVDDGGGDSGGGGDGGGGSTTPGVDLNLVYQSEWDAGFCMDGVVSNTTSATVEWAVSAAIGGTITGIWNAEHSTSGSETTFTGVGWNQEIGPGETAEFGFCADR